MLPYAGYLRKSRSDDPSEPLEITLRKHRALLERLAAEQSLTVSGWYEEVVTGESLCVRPQMLRLLGEVESGRYAGVLCVDIDRLGRGDMKDQGIILETFKYSGTRIITLEKAYDLNNELDEELTEFKTFLSRREYKMITKRLQRGIRQTVSEGAFVAPPPYGYERTVAGKRPTLKISGEEAGFVRMMFDLYVNQGAGCQSIADTVNALGARPRRSGAFTRGAVAHILKNPVYAGIIQWNRTQDIRKGKRGNDRHISLPRPREEWIETEGLHPAIISRELFDRAGELLRGRAHPPSNTGAVQNPLAGLCYCGHCGGRMTVHTSRGKWSYLKCLNRDCPCACANLAYVEEALLLHLGPLLAAIPLPPAEHGDISGLETALKTTRRGIGVCEAQLSRLRDLLEQGVYSTDLYLERERLARERLEALRGAQAEQAARLRLVESSALVENSGQKKSVLDVYRTQNAAGRNRLLKTLVEKIFYRKEPGWGPAQFDLEIQLQKGVGNPARCPSVQES